MRSKLTFFLIIQFFTTFSIQGTRPIVSLFADQQGASAFLIGLLVASVSVLPIIFAVIVGKSVDQLGPYKLAVCGGLFFFISLGLPAIFVSIWALFLSQILLGIGQILFGISFQKTTANLPGNRDKIIASTSFNASIAAFLAPLTSGYIYEYMGMQTLFSICAVLIFLNFAAVYFMGAEVWKPGAKQKETSEKVPQTRSVWTLLNDKYLRVALIIGALFNKGNFIFFFPVYANHIGMSPGTIGLIISVFNGTGMLVRVLQYRLVSTFGRMQLLFAIFLVSSVLYAFIPLSNEYILLIVISALLGAALGLGDPLSLVHSFNMCPKQRQGEMLGVRVTFNRTTAVATPILLGGLATIAGIASVFIGSSLILLIGAYMTRPPRKKDQHPVDHDSQAYRA